MILCDVAAASGTRYNAAYSCTKLGGRKWRAYQNHNSHKTESFVTAERTSEIGPVVHRVWPLESGRSCGLNLHKCRGSTASPVRRSTLAWSPRTWSVMELPCRHAASRKVIWLSFASTPTDVATIEPHLSAGLAKRHQDQPRTPGTGGRLPDASSWPSSRDAS